MNVRTTHGRRWLLAGCLAAIGLPVAQSQTVTSDADSGPGSLREALTSGTDGTVRFDASVRASTITLSSAIVVTRDVDIDGGGTTLSGAGLRFENAGESRITNLNIDEATAVSGAAVWAQGTDVYLFDSQFSGNTATGDMSSMGGGAVYVEGGTLYAQRVTFSDNSATGTSGSGGAILAGDGATLRILSSTFSGNSASRAGGAVEDQSGASTTASYFAVDFTGNTTGANPGNGGAIHVTGPGSLDITGGTATGNTAAAEGGAFWNGAGTMRVAGVTISGNVASGDDATNGGGGIFSAAGPVIVTGDTRITNNRADGASGSGGGILLDDGSSLEAYGTTISGNFASRAGGGIEDQSGASTTVILAQVDFTGNTTGSAPGNGGGFHITGPGNATLHGGSFVDNSAVNEGGGAWNGSGSMVVSGTTFTGNTVTDGPGGGALFNNGGVLSVKSFATVSGNSATGMSGSGGGILNDLGGTLFVTDVTFANNSANRAGGAIEDESASGDMGDNDNAGFELFVRDATFTGNTAGSAPGNGGAIHITGTSDADLISSTFTGNTAANEGGAIWNGAGDMQIRFATIDGNTASGDDADTGGGGVHNNGGTLDISNRTTITNNVADGAAGSGGGILNVMGGTLDIIDATIAGNSSNRAGGGLEDNGGGSMTIVNTDFARNTTGASPGNGGGLHITGPGNIRMVRVNFEENVAASEGGGFWNGAGAASVEDCRFLRNDAQGDDATNGGGAIFNLAGDLQLSNAYIGYNTASGTSGSGGGILFNEGSTGSIDVATIEYNEASRAGGGIEDQSGVGSGTIAVAAATIVWNETGPNPGNGGGIHITGPGDMSIEGSRFANNSAAAEGGGFWNGAGTATVRNSQFFDNDARGDDAANGGGAIFNLAGTLDLSFATIARNTASGASGSGGGILFNEGSTGSLSFVTLEDNSASRAGGAIEDQSGAGSGTIAIGDVCIRRNVTGPAPGNGGGIHITGPGDMSIARTLFEENTAANEGGGFWNGAGASTVADSRFLRNAASGADAANGGGGLFNLAGTLDVSDSYIGYNVADGASGSGGGILFVDGSGGSVTNSTIEYNSASRAGGGIEDQSGVMTTIALTDVDLLYNETGAAPGNGGGVHITGPGNMDITGGDVSYNTAASEGGGLWNGAGTMTVTDVNVTYNGASGAEGTNGGGGIFNNGGTLEVTRSLVAYNDVTGARAIGGGIHNANPGTASVFYSTISSNASAWNAGGIANAGTLVVTGSTVGANTAANRGGGIGQAMGATTATLRSTIVGANSAPVQGMQVDVAAGAYVSGGYNLIEGDDADVFPAAATDLEGSASSPVNPGLQPLNNNGGMTMTHGLDCTSDAIGTGDPGLTGPDQRGLPIVIRRDIGAHERQDVCGNNPGIVGEGPVAQTSFRLYPTATSGQVTVELAISEEDTAATDEGTYTFNVVSSDGRLLRTVETASPRHDLDVSGLRPGFYYVHRMAADGTVESQRFERL